MHIYLGCDINKMIQILIIKSVTPLILLILPWFASLWSSIDPRREEWRDLTWVLWKNSLHPQKNPKSNVNTQKPIVDRLRMVSLGNDSHPACVVKPVHGIPTFPLTAKAEKVKFIYLCCRYYKLVLITSCVGLFYIRMYFYIYNTYNRQRKDTLKFMSKC